MPRSILPFALLALAGCGGADQPPGGVSADEAAALNDAAVMLDANSVSPDAIDNREEATK